MTKKRKSAPVISDLTITRLGKQKLITVKIYSDETVKLASRYKKICMENLYTWPNMDEILCMEADKVLNVYRK
tara:strand:- start:124 stop:342 length:219 start_codon:yes stop_codon:yes gene_type:complete